MPAPRKITDEQRERIRQVAEARRKLPSDKQLARECGCSVNGVRTLIKRMFEPFSVVSCETNPAMIRQDGCSRPDRI